MGAAGIMFISMSFQYVTKADSLACLLPYHGHEFIKKEELKMVALWIVIGCMFMTGIGIRFTYKVLGLTPAEATAVFVLMVTLVGVNTAPAKVFLMSLF